MNAQPKEVFIQQEYPLGHRVGFDFGEVKLKIGGEVKTYYLAVWAIPASNFYWAYLCRDQKQDDFLDAHVKFFEEIGGVYHTVIYDNMRNVVTKFIRRNEKELNKEWVQLSQYHGFDIDTPHCFRGNEKGTVESRVKK